ncbi:hypothetical protein GJ688_18050 [Heliobacillus mobilis]|uniref:Uncharacterized protein n=1 Tax=Heliobacterium mobile TaxID=28064 RepID=A0A6I3SS05_HELMO|nr:hypothetical protein [Heliobacterium mobile]MTV50837.1 hypothetical protein [Heliobacterium mobile]
MDIRHKLYPYPVLSAFSDDYVDSQFISNVQVDKNIKEIVFTINILMDNKKLINLIEEEKAEYLIHIECSQTSYRAIFTTKEIEIVKNIPESKLNGKVAICSFIVAKEYLEEYTNDSFNEDYENTSFNIDRGSILAIGGQINVEITKEAEELSKIPSVFSILRRDTDENTCMKIEINSDKIKLWLSKKDFNNYISMANIPNFQPILHSILIVPALIYTFETLKSLGSNGMDEYDSYRWFKAFEKMFKKWNIKFDCEVLEKEGSYELAQKILDYPISRALVSLINIGVEDEEA